MKHFYIFPILLIHFISYSQVELTKGLIAYYPLDGNALDKSLNANNGIIKGAIPSVGSDGINGHSMDFKDGYIELTNGITLSDSAYTISLCFKNSEVNVRGSILKYYPFFDINTSYGQYMSPTCSLTVSNKNDFYIVEHPDYTISLNQWHHLLIEVTKTTYSAFLDGDLMINELRYGRKDSVLLSEVTFLNGSIGETFTGQIDEIKIFNRVLNNLEKESICKETLTVSQENVNEKSTIIYPTIAKSFININLKDSLFYHIYTPTGQLILSGTEKSIDLTNLNCGLHLIQIKTNTMSYSNSFYKQN